MYIIALLMLPSLTFAAPVPKPPEKPAVELKLSANNQLALEITIQNNGPEPLELPYRVTPLEHFVVELHGEQGKHYKIEHTGEKVDKAEPGTLTVPAGKSKTLSLHTCHYLSELGEGEQKVTFIARLKHDGQTIESKPLTVNP
jgi:hypothetical protein